MYDYRLVKFLSNDFLEELFHKINFIINLII
jgi:hypothetical protein